MIPVILGCLSQAQGPTVRNAFEWLVGSARRDAHIATPNASTARASSALPKPRSGTTIVHLRRGADPERSARVVVIGMSQMTARSRSCANLWLVKWVDVKSMEGIACDLYQR